MNKFTLPIDGTIPVMASLYEDEEFVTSQDTVGLYDGHNKSPEHQIGTINLTSHRLLYIDQSHPRTHSVSLNLSYVRQSEHYSGFLKSSSKVSLTLGMSASSTTTEVAGSTLGTASSTTTLVETDAAPRHFQEAWVCAVCSYNNPPTASEGTPKCVLCGVTKDLSRTTVASAIPIRPQTTLSTRSDQSTLVPSSSSRQQSASSAPSTSPLSSPSNRLPPDAAAGDDHDSIPCPACTFLNHKSMKICELCSTALRPASTPKLARSQPQSLAASRTSTPAPSETSGNSKDFIRISFRKGGDKAFYAALKRTLLEKAWTKSSSTSGATSARRSGGPQSGIHGIMESVNSNARAQHKEMSESLRDLEALMPKAKEMVQLAESLNARLSAQEQLQEAQGRSISTTEPEEATFIRSSMARLGLPSLAVTQDMVKDDQEYHEELAKELAAVLLGIGRTGSGGGQIKTLGASKGKNATGLINGNKGIIGLDEVWCGWNRARGIALLPPSTLLSVLPNLPHFTNPPIQLRTFTRTGLRVLHTPQFTHTTFSSRLLDSLSSGVPKTTVEVAQEEGVSVGLAEEMILAVEDDGEVLRDEGAGRYEPTRWYRNTMKALVYDGTLVL